MNREPRPRNTIHLREPEPTDYAAVVLHRLEQLEVGQTEIKVQASKDRDVLFRQIKKVDEDVDELKIKIVHLEKDAQTTRWIFAGIGAITAIFLRDVMPRIVKWLMEVGV